MTNFREIAPEQLEGNVFQMIGKEWMLIGAKSGGQVNMMTASWGGVGVLWKRPVVFAFVRPQRHTKMLIDDSRGFSCTFFSPEYKEQMNLCGTKSGRDIDKVAACGFQVLEAEGIPYFAQAHTALICQKLYVQRLHAPGFLDNTLDSEHYPLQDHHDMYVAEIRKVLVRDAG